MKYEQYQLESIKRIYDAIIIFLEEFLNTDGFNDLWIEFIDKGIKKNLSKTNYMITLWNKLITLT